MALARTVIAVCWLGSVGACSKPQRAPQASGSGQASVPKPMVVDRLDSVEAAATWEHGTPLRTLRGAGFALEYPAGARLDTGSSYPTQIPGTVISGPAFEMKGKWAGNFEPVARRGPAYRLVVATLPNPQHLTLEQFVDSSVKRYNAKLGPDFPLGHAGSYAAVFGGQDARVVQPPCGDCWPRDVYFVRGDRAVVLSFTTDDNDMLDAVTAPLYWLLVSTFRWTT